VFQLFNKFEEVRFEFVTFLHPAPLKEMLVAKLLTLPYNLISKVLLSQRDLALRMLLHNLSEFRENRAFDIRVSLVLRRSGNSKNKVKNLFGEIS
jgi:hypothetical protein